ncbi:hypothetical protein Lp90_1499 [Lactiplantibacillus plantarum]|nr:hypothetical protein Lp90_1499 [Lactiplantibacillus plantarum]
MPVRGVATTFFRDGLVVVSYQWRLPTSLAQRTEVKTGPPGFPVLVSRWDAHHWTEISGYRPELENGYN